MQPDNKKPLISVIVPFFNIEKYVSLCLDSLLAQDFHDFEIVCVDDGSTDGTSALLDSYADSTDRVSVVHVANGGLSSARNTGVRHARADLVSFVDGDDVVSPFYLSSLYSALIDMDCDISIGTFHKIDLKPGSIAEIDWIKPTTVVKVPIAKAIDAMLYDNPMISSWAHLCRKEVYENAPFVEGRLFEDSLSFKEHVTWATSIAFIKEPIYGYVNRSGSITSLDDVSAFKIRQFELMLDDFQNDMASLGVDHSKALTYHLALECSRFIRMLSRQDASSKIKSKQIISFIRTHLGQLVTDKRIPMINRIRFILLSASLPLYLTACDWYDARHS